jgi:hypothetical protein
MMFFKDFEFWVDFVKFMSQSSTNHFSENLVQRLLIWIFVLGGLVFGGIAFEVCFLSLLSNAFICCFNGDSFNFTNWHSVNHSLCFVRFTLQKLGFLSQLLFLNSIKTSLLCLIKVCFKSLIFPFVDMISCNEFSRVSKTHLIFNSLQLLFF